MPGKGTDAGSHGPAVRLLDEHDRRVVVLKLDAVAHEAPGPAGARSAQRSRPRRRGVRALAVALIALGSLAVADAVVTLVWQEPFSALYAKLRQDHLSGVLRHEERAGPTPAERRTLARLRGERARISYLAAELQRHARDGAAVGRIRIPRIGANFVIVNGTDTSALESGPGVFPETLYPGRGGTTAIAGHRTTYLAPFRHIDELRRGSSIVLEMPYASFTYTVIGSRVVAPTDVHAAVAYVGYQRLVLSACTPLFSAAKRILVFARLRHATLTPRARAAGALTSGARSRPAPPPRPPRRVA
ncbi:MAG TPA: class E sortase [Solirubrobacteraceae bacterium]|jgi:sortase A|nr:class E sortase [Solirubrobacteraceae bacterium]